jgi:DNA repair exonuclease SbcCD ATPase subunit
MEKEQLEKKVEWLDVEHRNALVTIAALEERLAAMEKTQTKRESSSKTLTTYKSRLDTFDKSLADFEKQIKGHQAEIKTEIQEIAKQAAQLEKNVQQENKGLNKIVDDFRKEGGKLQVLQKNLSNHMEQLKGVEVKFESFKESIQDIITGEQKRAQLAESLEQSSREDTQRLGEMHAEVAALLTRLESAAKQTESIRLSQHKVESRMDEVFAAEVERKKAQDEFLSKAAMEQTDWQHQWKDWGKRFEGIEKQSGEVAERLKEFDSTEVALKRAQQAFDSLVEKINRRVNELSEIQRLGDQRFRQEWSTFQADGQKRWAGFTLTHEEQQRESGRLQVKLAAQVVKLEESLSEVQDTVQHLSEQSERNLQNLLEMARDSLAEHERFLSSSAP